MRVFLFISNKGDSLSLAQRIADEGNRVLFYINDLEAREVGNGLIEKHNESRQVVGGAGRIDTDVFTKLLNPNPDCVICDSCNLGFGVLSDMFRSSSIPVIGSGEWAERVENDTLFGAQVMLTMGVGVSEVRDGIVINTEAWFNGVEVIGVNHTIKNARLMPGELGPKADMGNVVWIGRQSSRLYKESLEKLVPLLKKLRYRGPISIDTNIDESGMYGLKLTPRFNYNAFYVLLEMLKGKINDLMYGVATGVLRNMFFKSQLGIGVTLAVPPFPYTCPNKQPYAIEGLDKQNLKHFWGYDFKSGYTTAGAGGYIGTVTARGDEIQDFSPLRDAKRRAFRTLGNIKACDGMYRSDIGGKVERNRAQLKTWGWL